MFGWLAKKSENARIYMCVKDLKWNLEGSSGVDRAQLLAIAVVLGDQFFGEDTFPKRVADRPLDFPKDQLLRVYEVLEEVRNHNEMELSSTKKRLAQVGMTFPEGAEEHAKRTARALEVWMATVASGIVTERRDEVRSIWKLLHTSKPHLGEAFENIVDTEKQIMSFTGQDDWLFTSLDRQQWRDMCSYVPSQFQSELL